ncbi:MAG: isoprenyl transferase [Bacteroidales bacterium]|nr:isoprenyl transferase [Bacteroidales bacterium]MBN2750474.1 isoprenyl transferase [Bacteroidales bacterium]
MSLKESIVKEQIPQHIAIIMDGNGRWAKKRGNQRIFGHRNGVNAVRAVTEAAGELGVKYLTLYAFSTENWNRPRPEIEALMSLLVSTINSETDTLLKNGVCLRTIGDTESLPPSVAAKLKEATAKTSGCNGLNLILALNYSSRWEITNAMTRIAKSVLDGQISPANITSETISSHLCTGGIPDPELIIRTSGEYRLSNFLLWQAAYSEFYFTDVLWPDFDKEELYRAIVDFQKRERRFGKISEQL